MSAFKGRASDRETTLVSTSLRCGLSAALLAPLLACSSGGGNSSGGSDSGFFDNPNATFFSQVAEPAQPYAATDWSGSQEYINSTGLDQVNAAEGYARRTLGQPGGAGVRIAIIDTGIDVTHLDLGNLSAQSWSAGGEPLAGDSHGTFVAGIAAASRTQTGDSNDMHGVAYQATLINFQTIRPSTGDTTFASSDLVDAISMAAGISNGSTAVESDIINLSLGAFSTSDSTFNSLRTAMQAAAAEEKIMVIAAGNEGLDGDTTRKLQPIFPAAYADDAGIAGHAIVVGNLRSDNTIAPSSNHCGDTRDYCLFAPGTNIRSTLNGGSYGIGSGTSFAAPYVTGAAAVVKAAFPGVSSEDVVDRLLLTAQDLGATGVDDVFGHGLLDLEAAMNPVGPVGLTIEGAVDEVSAYLTDTSLLLGQAWAMDHGGRALLARAVGFDEMGFPFAIDLDERVTSASSTNGLETFVARNRGASARTAWSQASLAVSMARQGKTHKASLASTREQHSATSPHLAFSAEPMAGVRLFSSVNGSSGTTLGLEHALGERAWSPIDAGASLAPFDRLAGPVAGGGVAFSLSEGVEIALSAFANMPADAGHGTALQKLELAKDIGDSLTMRLGLGALQQDSGFLGSDADGGFGGSMDSRSTFAEVGVIAALTDRIDWFGAYSRGESAINGSEGALLGDWSAVQADTFATGAAIRHVARKGDRFSLIVGQPLRGRKARATMTVPVGRTTDGQVITEEKRVDFSPSSREIKLDTLYRRPLGGDGSKNIALGSFIRFNPDHDNDRLPDIGLGVRYHWRF